MKHEEKEKKKPPRQTAVQTLEAKEWGPGEGKNINLISEKLRTEKVIYEIAKAKSVDVIDIQIYRNRLNLLESHTTALSIWDAIWEDFDITCAFKIGSTTTNVIGKSFVEYATIEEAYNDITSWLTNKNGNKY